MSRVTRREVLPETPGNRSRIGKSLPAVLFLVLTALPGCYRVEQQGGVETVTFALWAPLLSIAAGVATVVYGLRVHRTWSKSAGAMLMFLGPALVVIATPMLLLNKAVVDDRHFENVDGMWWKMERQNIAFDDVSSLRLKTQEKETRRGKYLEYQLLIDLKDGTSQTVVIRNALKAAWPDLARQFRATALTTWPRRFPDEASRPQPRGDRNPTSVRFRSRLRAPSGPIVVASCTMRVAKRPECALRWPTGNERDRTPVMRILLIDDEASLRRTFRITLESMGHQVTEASGGAQAMQSLAGDRFDLAFLDLRLGREAGLDLLPALRREAPEMGVVVVTAYASVGSAVEAMRGGAFDYLPKPFTPDQVRVVLERWNQVRGLHRRVEDLQQQVRAAQPETDLHTTEPVMRQALDVAFQVAATDATVLLRGESGTGKGVLARAIHARSPRAAGPLVTVHCPSLSRELLESELFGHVRGAFTGAVRDTEGKVGVAEGGTLFLDEVGDLPGPLQPKLLRLLQEKTYERVGETKTRTADVRLLAATNRDLEAEVAAGHFREDLLYRLNVIEVWLPSLRQRRADVLPLAERLLRFFAGQAGKAVTSFTPAAREALTRHPWPGNVRELRNAVERGVILTAGPAIDVAQLPVQVASPSPTRFELGGSLTLDELEAEHIRRVLAAVPSLDEAAQTLGIDPSTLYRKRKRHGL